MPRTRRFVRVVRRRQHAARHVVHVRLLGGLRPGRRAQHEAIAEPHVDRGERTIEQRVLAAAAASADRAPATSWPSGSITSVPLLSRRFQRRSPTRTAATTRFCRSGRSVSASISVAAAAGAPGPTTSGSWRNSATFWLATTWPVAVDQHELALVLPDGERPALLQDDDDGAGQPALDGGVLDPGQGLHALARHLDREAEDRIARADAERRAQQRFGRVGAALDHHVGDAQAGEGRAPPKPFAQRGERAAGCGRVHRERTPSSTTSAGEGDPGRRDAAAASAGAAAASTGRAGPSPSCAGRGSRAACRVLHHPGAELRRSSCRDAPPVPAAARSA